MAQLYDSVLEQINEIQHEVYSPDEEERLFLKKAYSDISLGQKLQTQPLELLNRRNIIDFISDSQKDYNLYVAEQRSDEWAKIYRRPITRDKANVFISNLTRDLIYPTVFAQNKDQVVDRIVSKVLRSLLEHAEKNDGGPTDSGHSKFVRTVHKCVSQGTVHVEDGIDEDGRLCKQIVPNDEILIPNYWQQDIQKQGWLIRLQNHVTYEEAEVEFGDLPTWKHVRPGRIANWTKQDTFFKGIDTGTYAENEVQIARIWRPGGKGKKYFNVCINGVLMFDPKNLSPFKHGLYPIYKGIFEMLDSEFYWGNSLPNKAQTDQAIYDAFYTIILNKAKLNLLPPMVSMNGLHVDQNIIVPGKISPVNGNISDLQKIPGVAEEIKQGDVAMLSLLERSHDSSTASPIIAGQAGGGEKTAREVILQESNAQKLLGSFGLMIGFLVSAGAYPRLKNIIQYYPRKKINELAKVSVGSQMLSDGRSGTLEVIFDDTDTSDKEKVLLRSTELLKEEEASSMAGEPKKKVFINPKYLNDLDLYVSTEANTILKQSDAINRAMTIEAYSLLKDDPNIRNREEVTRQLIRSLQWDEERLMEGPAGQEAMNQNMMNEQANALGGAGSPVASGTNEAMRSVARPPQPLPALA